MPARVRGCAPPPGPRPARSPSAQLGPRRLQVECCVGIEVDTEDNRCELYTTEHRPVSKSIYADGTTTKSPMCSDQTNCYIRNRPILGASGYEMIGKGCCRTSWVDHSGKSPDSTVKLYSGASSAVLTGDKRKHCQHLCSQSNTAGLFGDDVTPFDCIGYEWSPPSVNSGKGARCELYADDLTREIGGVTTELELIGVDRAPAQCKAATRCIVKSACPLPDL